ncbi:DUF4367 domain-containing protein [Desulfosporosinus youngiae]|uniref:DUF4367 domain-containing protein n=1 Tax=Desulfosporosinus youngiae DSM 17734 TaxID=768710 RepID=H5Y529_9FIRM|nr:DUF4367 domain-containing protein [Desulfosporosinus youngiae]EHQ90133.1 hypothetical protein DesyoDRAFT_3096 [Desulfosporosinus youngiae DSM 17734]
MEEKTNNSYPPDISSDKEIIKKILSEKESDAIVKDKLYRILYEASSADEISMDTDLIDECVKAIDLIEGKEEYLSEEKVQAMRRNVDRRYKNWCASQRKIHTKKRVAQIAACFIIIFFTSSVAANAFGYNFIQSMVQWGKDTFNLSTQNYSNGQNSNTNIAQRNTYSSVEEVIKGLPLKPLSPKWFPDGFTFKYAEKFARSDSLKILLYYQDNTNKAIVFDLSIYDDSNKAAANINFEKDEKLVEIYEKNNVKHYIMNNLGQVQAVWSDSVVVYNISSDVSADEMKKIIDSMYGG